MICTEQTIGYRPVQSTKKKKEKCKIKKDKKLLHLVLAQDNIDNVVSEIDLHSVVNVVAFCVSGLGIFVSEIRATVVNHIVNHGLTMQEAGQRVQPNISRFSVASILWTFR